MMLDRLSGVAEAADDNFVVHATWAAQQLPSMRTRVGPELALVDSGLPCDTFNIACRARLAPDRPALAVQMALDFFAAGSNLFSWWVGPADQPANLRHYLEAAGLVYAGGELAMAASLHDLPSDWEVPAGLEIRRVTNPAQLAAFARTITPDPHALRFYQLAAPVLFAPASPHWFYLGYMDGAPVATLEETIGGGLAGLYNITTLATHRGRGIASALTWRALDDARAAGQPCAVLQAAPAGVNVYRRLGFAPFGEIAEFKPASCES
jgi:ribosomal protein S18 acetylase RimI-like enzyme